MEMPTQPRPQARLFMLISFAVWGSVIIRWISELLETHHPMTPLVGGILVLFGILLGLEARLTNGARWRMHAYLAFQTGLVLLAVVFHYQLDFFALLFIPLGGQAVLGLPRRQASIWTAILIAAVVIGQINQFGFPDSISFTLLYSAGLIFVAAFSLLTIQAQEAERRSQELLADLQVAHLRLQEFAGQAEELAAARERDRLARDLHDSVAQTLYGLTLQSEAALRGLSAGNSQKAMDSLRDIRHSAQESLRETRLLIHELRPAALEEAGLAAAIRERLESVETRSGIRAHVDLEELVGLPPEIETACYRIAMEALNNSLKHAGASIVNVRLAKRDGCLLLEIADDGRGFDPAGTPAGGLGLQGMQARAGQIGASLMIESHAGEGTRIKLEVPGV